MIYKNFEELLSVLKKDSRKKYCAVASAAEEHTLLAVLEAAEAGIIEPILVGPKDGIQGILKGLGCEPNRFEIVDCPPGIAAAQESCRLIAAGRANCLMKGMLETAELMKTVLNQEYGLRGNGLLSAVSLLEIPGYHKLLCTTDPGLNLYPDVEQKEGIIRNAVEMMQGLGVETPKVAVLAAVETVNPKMQATLDAAELKRRNQEGRIAGCIVDGPLSYDIAMSAEAAAKKGMESPVAGDPDILVYPNIDVGNIAGKALVYTGKAKSAAIMVGARIPIINTSRSLSVDGKVRAIALAAACGGTEG